MIGHYFIQNNTAKTAKEFENPFQPGKLNIYEVVRVDSGIPLFVEDHLERLKNSFSLAGIRFPDNTDNIITGLLNLINLNKISEGLIRIVFNFENDEHKLLIFQSRVKFPDRKVYNEGVTCTIQYAERNNPEAKIYNHEVRDTANRLIAEKKVFETLLANHNGMITEGSRSNVFFVQDDTLITAPEDMVLQGITRTKVLDIAHHSGINVICSTFEVKKLSGTDAVFLTGTTPKVMPVKQIDNYHFDVKNKLTRFFIDEYNKLTEEYKANAAKKFKPRL
jgi:branched-chain amino acid aminotransferase